MTNANIRGINYKSWSNGPVNKYMKKMVGST